MKRCRVVRGGEGFRDKLEDSTSFRHGPKLEHTDTVAEGGFVYIPAAVPHQPFNPADQVARALIARTDPNEQESVVLLPMAP